MPNRTVGRTWIGGPSRVLSGNVRLALGLIAGLDVRSERSRARRIQILSVWPLSRRLGLTNHPTGLARPRVRGSLVVNVQRDAASAADAAGLSHSLTCTYRLADGDSDGDRHDAPCPKDLEDPHDIPSALAPRRSTRAVAEPAAGRIAAPASRARSGCGRRASLGQRRSGAERHLACLRFDHQLSADT